MSLLEQPSGPRPSPPTGEAVLELLHPGQHVQVPLAAQLPVVASRVPRVERVKPNHVEGLRRPHQSWVPDQLGGAG